LLRILDKNDAENQLRASSYQTLSEICVSWVPTFESLIQTPSIIIGVGVKCQSKTAVRRCFLIKLGLMLGKRSSEKTGLVHSDPKNSSIELLAEPANFATKPELVLGICCEVCNRCMQSAIDMLQFTRPVP
jgi:hypothetical protein